MEEFANASESSTGLGAREFPGVLVSLEASVERHLIPARNVLGLVRGTDPELAKEVVLVTAHHDHNGTEAAAISIIFKRRGD